MNWYKIAETTAEKSSFLLADLSYYPAFLKVKKKTKKLESFASYIDWKNNLISEFMIEDERANKATFGYNFFLDNQKLNKYISDIQEIIKKVDNYKKYIDKTDLDKISISEIVDLFQRGVPLYNKAVGLYLVSQPEYTEKIESFIVDKLKGSILKKDINDIFITLTSSSQPSCLENERYEWLKNIVIPVLAKCHTYRQTKKDNKILGDIEKHIRKYKYYSASIEFDLWDKEHYLELLKNDFRKGKLCLNNELSDIRNKRKINQRQKEKVIKQHKINYEVYKKAEIVAELGVLRLNLRILGWQFFNYLFPKLIDISAEKLKISKDEIGALFYIDFIKLLKKQTKELKPSQNLKKRRDKHILVSITPQNGYQIFWGKSADKKFGSMDEKINKVEEFKGIVANKKGIVQGKAFLFQWGSKDFNTKIYKFPRGAILIAGQTKPLLMPAIRKAKAIITDEGGLLCHAAIVSRELNIPCVINTKIATKMLNDNDIVEINTKTGLIKILRKSK